MKNFDHVPDRPMPEEPDWPACPMCHSTDTTPHPYYVEEYQCEDCAYTFGGEPEMDATAWFDIGGGL